MDTLPPLKYGNNIIKQTKPHKILGIIFDEGMTFKAHINTLSHKIIKEHITTLLSKVPHVKQCPTNTVQCLCITTCSVLYTYLM